MIVTAHQPAYLPWLGLLHKAALADTFVLMDNVQFEKDSFVNRNKLRSPEGWRWLTVPVLSREYGEMVRLYATGDSAAALKSAVWAYWRPSAPNTKVCAPVLRHRSRTSSDLAPTRDRVEARTTLTSMAKVRKR